MSQQNFKAGLLSRVPAPIRDKYAKQLTELTDRMMNSIIRDLTEVKDTTTDPITFDASPISQSRITLNALKKYYNSLFADKATNILKSLFYQVDKSTSVNAKSSLASVGATVKTIKPSARTKALIKASSAENVALIKSISEEALGRVEKTVYRSLSTGQGMKDLVPELQRIGGITKRRARFIAIDQTQKIYNAVAASKQQDAGFVEFEWIHSGGGAYPRKLHQSYDGKIFRYDDPPIIDESTGERGLPGQAINCRCTLRPIFKFPTD